MSYVPDLQVIWANLPFLLAGAATTLEISAGALAVGLVAAGAVALARGSANRAARLVALCFTEPFRATPLLIQLYIIAFGLPSLGLRLDPLQAGFVGLVLYNAAYCSEILRAGFGSVPSGQRLAAQSLGFSAWQAFRHVVLPQALRNVMPALGNQFIDTALSSSLLEIIGAPELTQHATSLAARTFRPIEVFAAAGAIYLVITMALSNGFALLSNGFALLERQSRRPRRA